MSETINAQKSGNPRFHSHSPQRLSTHRWLCAPTQPWTASWPKCRAVVDAILGGSPPQGIGSRESRCLHSSQSNFNSKIIDLFLSQLFTEVSYIDWKAHTWWKCSTMNFYDMSTRRQSAFSQEIEHRQPPRSPRHASSQYLLWWKIWRYLKISPEIELAFVGTLAASPIIRVYTSTAG